MQKLVPLKSGPGRIILKGEMGGGDREWSGHVMQKLVPLKSGPGERGGEPSTYVRRTICVYALMVPIGPPVYAWLVPPCYRWSPWGTVFAQTQMVPPVSGLQ